MAFTVDITPKAPSGVIDETKQFTAAPVVKLEVELLLMLGV
ncbi:head decoration protein [Escherichia phage vB_EcoM-UFV05]|nr:head decoration protein [Escherichia phage vB_EcoM-UFV05]UYL84044.1 head decoration protein [Escherichia phage vB_EcoM-UFV06]